MTWPEELPKEGVFLCHLVIVRPLAFIEHLLCVFPGVSCHTCLKCLLSWLVGLLIRHDLESWRYAPQRALPPTRDGSQQDVWGLKTCNCLIAKCQRSEGEAGEVPESDRTSCLSVQVRPHNLCFGERVTCPASPLIFDLLPGAR